jgi:23S rRNA (guanosine2251-2'-O)-methyltransferase
MKKLSMDELQRLSPDEFKHVKKIPLTLVLDNVRSMNNVGSVFRSADAFSVEQIYLCGISPQPPHREIHKTALGATETVEWRYVDDIHNLISALKTKGYTLVAIEQVENARMLPGYFPARSEKLALILGNEVEGVQQSVIDECDFCIEIPQFGTKHSLNISVAAGIVIYDLSTKMRSSGA